MKKLIQFLAMITFVAVSWGCKESFLELAPVSNPNADNFYKTKTDFDLATNAAYNTLYTVYHPQGAVSYAGELMSDNVTIFNISGNQADKWQFRDYSLAPANTMVYQFWQDFYKSLYNINIILSKIETAELDAAYKSQVQGEMLFLRSLYYFNMVRIWGDVPLVTAPVTAAESYNILRAPSAEIYAQIIKDLADAKSKLAVTSAIAGRATKGAAQALLGKVYLTSGDKANAAKELKEVYDSKKYELLPSYASLWDVKNKNSKESIFEIQYLGGAATNPYSNYYLEFFPNSNALGFYGAGMNQVVDDLWNEYEKGDTRKEASIDTGFTDAKGNFTAAKFPKKWTDKTAPLINQSIASNNNFIVLRYADLLLLLTEATGDVTYLNQVRKRSNLPLYGETGYPAKYSTVELALEHERRVELAFEFQRWFDLKRTNRALPVLTQKGKSVTQDKLLLPIPNIVRDQNAKITQNNGY
ncbi:RagB/SusD family nutrient uptake outer membrane protein [Dyadobacter pollutisoli]|uniref:RagB/SusD family nutrient uptake outer membrane protein n=1 Tax=Dyadobacter pollutisoli TaxID=2910158 RepID=A0A9E8SLT4_9BACT|nr:RagB/SusD family nutrient uptake outer membrane protein [Dyadobacter pollutisoli]WAC13965.1 RagB/SusD family nutrient uptake outer membrane protein [Dyadobacter pollutisoli]